MLMTDLLETIELEVRLAAAKLVREHLEASANDQNARHEADACGIASLTDALINLRIQQSIQCRSHHKRVTSPATTRKISGSHKETVRLASINGLKTRLGKLQAIELQLEKYEQLYADAKELTIANGPVVTFDAVQVRLTGVTEVIAVVSALLRSVEIQEALFSAQLVGIERRPAI
jgi:hypothetical protein